MTSWYLHDNYLKKFIYSEKATKFEEIILLVLTIFLAFFRKLYVCLSNYDYKMQFTGF